ncbi:MAG: hypothetical protein E2O75_07955 [Chloroflexi bacterium]|nr:MAG: hypothetical protein E2O75_07955 [Chloroflexota bacterium]
MALRQSQQVGVVHTENTRRYERRRLECRSQVPASGKHADSPLWRGGVLDRLVAAGVVVTDCLAPASPWQNPYVERVIGSLRRELLDHVIVLNQRHLKQLLASYLDYYHPWRTHRSLDQDAPVSRPVQIAKPDQIAEFPVVHGLHHYYLPRAA